MANDASQTRLNKGVGQILSGFFCFDNLTNNTKDAVKAAEEQGKITQQDTQVLKKTKLETKDVKVDPVVQNPILSPELQKLIAGLPEGKALEFGEQPSLDQKKNVEEIKQEAAGIANTEAKNTQGSTAQTTTTDTKQPQGSTKEGQIGPFAGPMERLGYLTGTMKKAVAEWWSKNKVTVIIGLVAGIAGLILANIATGGAIMAALPLLLQIVGAIFTGIGILDMAKHFGKYLTQAFPDKTIAGGAKSLARGLAALTIELIFSLLFGGKALLESAKKGIKTVAKKGVKGAVKAGAKAARKNAVKGIKNTAQNFKDLGGVARDGWGTLMKNGKIIFKGAKRGVISGAKTLDDVAKRLAKKFRFKKFKIVIKKRRFQILGEFNPLVLIAEGNISQVKKQDIPGNPKIGDKITINGKVVTYAGENIDEYVKHLKKTHGSKFYRWLGSVDDLSTANFHSISDIVVGSKKGLVGKLKSKVGFLSKSDDALRKEKKLMENKLENLVNEYKRIEGLDSTTKKIRDAQIKYQNTRKKYTEQLKKAKKTEHKQDLKNKLARLDEDFSLTDQFKNARPGKELVPAGTKIPREHIEVYKYAQKIMNDLYRKTSEFGDGGNPIMIVLEQLKGGKKAASVAPNTLHLGKSEDILGKVKQLSKYREFPPNIKKVFADEAKRLEEAIKWAKKFKNGVKSGQTLTKSQLDDLPKWARSGENWDEIEKLIKKGITYK